MTIVAHDVTNQDRACCAANATQGKRSGWFGTSCSLCALAGLVLVYIPAVLPFVAASCLLRIVRGR